MKQIITLVLPIFFVTFLAGCSSTNKSRPSKTSARVMSPDYSRYPIITQFVIPSRVLKGGSLREGMTVQDMHAIMGVNATSVNARITDKVHSYPAIDCIENVDAIERLPEEVKQRITVSGKCSITVADGSITGWNFEGISVKSATFCNRYVTLANGIKHCMSGLPYEVIIK